MAKQLEPKQIREMMTRKGRKKRWSMKDVNAIRVAKETGDWTTVHEKEFYQNHGGDYCALLEVLAIED